MKLAKSLMALLFALMATAALAEKVSPETVDGATTVDAAQAKALFDEEVAFVDPRSDSDWDAGRIPGAIHLNIKTNFNKDSLAAEVSADEKVVMYCNGHSCLRSSDAAKMAVEWGYKQVYYFRDGFPAWQAAGYPVE